MPYTITMARKSLRLLPLLCALLLPQTTVLCLASEPPLSVYERIYSTIDSASPCFRLTNATHQIGCSASSTNTRGVLHYIEDRADLDWLLENGPYPPYIALLEPELFNNGSFLQMLKASAKINGILLRFYNETASGDAYRPQEFSPERRCPNDAFSAESCDPALPWNPVGNGLLFHDFGDFPIFALPNKTFENVKQCFLDHNVNTTGKPSDYPLCSAELSADMHSVKDTPTCYRRANLPIPYLNGLVPCDALGDMNVWGTLFNLSNSSADDIIMLTTKLDSVSFFPNLLSYGANSEVAGIATLLAVIKELGKLKIAGTLTETERPILYVFFHGESWDYIGSSRMVYDMENGVFPFEPSTSKKNKKIQLPQLGVANISSYLELSQLGVNLAQDQTTFFIHGDKDSSFIQNLTSVASSFNLSLSPSSSSSLPPVSLHQFLRSSPDFSGSVLAGYDTQFTNKFFGSRYDNIANVGDVGELADLLSRVATAVAKTALSEAGPDCGESCIDDIAADPSFIEEVLDCFLVNSSCQLFQSVVIKGTAEGLAAVPLGRYVTAESILNPETIILTQMVASFTANNASNLTTPTSCKSCLKSFKNYENDQTVNVTWMQFNGSEDQCLCVHSFTYHHTATSPAFKLKDYASTRYSTWAESVWTAVSFRMYLVPYTFLEVAFLFVGVAMTAVSLLVAVQCSRKGALVFAAAAAHYYAVN